MNILFLSDFLPVPNLRLTATFRDSLRNADRIVFNLEGSPFIHGKGNYRFRIMPFEVESVLQFMEKFGKQKFIVALANNHILDDGGAAFDRLVSIFEKHGIQYIGTKERPFISINGEVSILNFVTAETVAPINGWNRLNYVFYNSSRVDRQIKELEATEQLLILYPHWGRDLDRTRFNTYNFAYDKDRWFVFGHHPHVISEVSCRFIYSLGNTFIPHPNYYKRFMSVHFGLAVQFNSDLSTYSLVLTRITSSDKFDSDFLLDATSYSELPREVVDYIIDFSTMKNIFLRCFAFTGNVTDYFKLVALQGIAYFLKLRYKIINFFQ